MIYFLPLKPLVLSVPPNFFFFFHFGVTPKGELEETEAVGTPVSYSASEVKPAADLSGMYLLSSLPPIITEGSIC